MFVKIVIVAGFLAILVSLGSGLVGLLNPKKHSNHTVKALTYRITLSIALFIFLIVAFAMGLIQPHGL